MANTYHKIIIQTVFAVKYRKAILEKPWRSQVFAVIGNLINQTGCKTYIINGVEDHVHCFFGLKPSLAVSDVMKSAKSKASKYINDNGLTPERFSWQVGFGTFSYSESHKDRVYRYIQNQEEHHMKKTFKEEYREQLIEHNIDFDEAYLFDDLI